MDGPGGSGCAHFLRRRQEPFVAQDVLGRQNKFFLLNPLITLASVTIGIVRCGYTIWCLNQPEVQSWMFKKSTGQV